MFGPLILASALLTLLTLLSLFVLSITPSFLDSEDFHGSLSPSPPLSVCRHHIISSLSFYVMLYHKSKPFYVSYLSSMRIVK
jgi:hypothetical protein